MKTAGGPTLLRSTSRRIVTLVLVGYFGVASVGPAASAGNAQAAAVAQWVPRKVHFMYLPAAPSSETTFYSCDALQVRITAILSRLAARDATIKTFGCFTNGPERLAGVDATFSVLQPAAGNGQSASSPVDAQWQRVTLSSDDSCALMEQVKRSILPLFATRNPTPSCSPTFSVDVLQPIATSPP
jgi:hypothetical protein